MIPRLQRTLARPAEIRGVGFLTGADVLLRCLPAPADEGISFARTDLFDSEPIPALSKYAVPRGRRTAISRGGATVEMIEHVMAALAGLCIDNCRVEVNAPEPPGCDGSSLWFVDALLTAGIETQEAVRKHLVLTQPVTTGLDQEQPRVMIWPSAQPGWTISYELDYGPESPIPAQRLCLEITPDSFIRELAFARTFLLEHEAQALRAQGVGTRVTTRDLLIYGPNGVIDNQVRIADECVRHKILDCVGDLALLGCDISGYMSAHRSGHTQNGAIVQEILRTHAQAEPLPAARAA